MPKPETNVVVKKETNEEAEEAVRPHKLSRSRDCERTEVRSTRDKENFGPSIMETGAADSMRSMKRNSSDKRGNPDEERDADELPEQSTSSITRRSVYKSNRPESTRRSVYKSDRPESTLYDCLINDTIDMYGAARIVLQQKSNGTFSRTIYDEFIHHAASRVRHFNIYGLLRIHNQAKGIKLHSVSNMVMCEIQSCKYARIIRSVEIGKGQMKESTVPEGPVHIAVTNCTRDWIIDGPRPFKKKMSLCKAIARYVVCQEQPSRIFAAIYRFLLMKITEPAYKIQQFSLRLNDRGGRDERLQNLPAAIESTLIDFMEDVIGYGHRELKAPSYDMSNSSYFVSLGRSEKERRAELKRLSAERIAYRKIIFKALQAAMRDIRSYDYDRAETKWIASDRKKRALPPKEEEE